MHTRSLAPDLGPAQRSLLRLGIAGLIAADVLILVFLDHALIALGAVAALAGGLILAARLPWTLALIAVGSALLDPIVAVLGSTSPVFWGLRLILAGGIAWLLLSRAPSPAKAIGRIVADPVFVLALLFGIVLAAGALETASPDYARMKTLHYFATNMPLLATAMLLRGAGEAAVRRLWAAVLACALLVCGAGLANVLLGFEPYESRLSVLGLNPIWLGRIAALGLLSLIMLREERAVSARGVAAAVLPMIAVLVLSGSRGPFLGLTLIVLFRGFFLGRVTAGRRAALLAGVLVLLAVVVAASPDALRERWLNPMRQDTSGIVRLRLFAVAQDIFSALPFGGVGTGGFSDLMKFGDHRFYPHNIFLEIGIENGIPGLVALLAFLFIALRRGLLGRGSVWGRAALLGFLFALWNAQFSGDVMANEWIWLFAGLVTGRRDPGAS